MNPENVIEHLNDRHSTDHFKTSQVVSNTRARDELESTCAHKKGNKGQFKTIRWFYQAS